MMNHPKTSESICRDVLEVDPENQDAVAQLIIAITGDFPSHSRPAGGRLKEARSWLSQLKSPFLQEYFAGLILERWAKARVRELPGNDLFEFMEEALQHYENAMKIAPAGDESPLLHYNVCVRFIEQHPHIKPHEVHPETQSPQPHYGDGIHHH